MATTHSSNFIDLTGKTFGRWQVVSLADERSAHNMFQWVCQCSCGSTKVVLGMSLRNGDSRSCGCLQKDTAARLKRKHGMHKSKINQAWRDMFQRCYNPNAQEYKNYGGRGIKVCPEWKSFDAFLNDMGHPPSQKHSIDRINNDGDYEPGNCRWATKSEQGKNQRRTTFVEMSGIRLCIADWADRLKMNRHTLYVRKHRGLSPKEILRPFKC